MSDSDRNTNSISDSRSEWGYAIVRLDVYPSTGGVRVEVAIKSVYWDEITAEAEVERLNAVNKARRSSYVLKPARLMPRDQ